jgi:putative ABC transport system permease protein
MPLLFRASLGFLSRHPWQLGLALLGICTGVAVMVAIDLANESSRKAFFMSMDTINGKATHQIVAGPGGIDEKLYSRLRVAHGIRNIAPVVSGYLQAGESTFELIGVDVFAEREFRTYSSTANVSADLLANEIGQTADGPQELIRKMLTTPGALLMSEDNAASMGLRSLDKFTVLVNGHEQIATLAGVLAGDDSAALQTVVVADISVAQAWLEKNGRLTRIDVLATEPAVLDVIRAELPAGASIVTSASRAQSAVAMSDAFTTNLTAMSLLALLVGIFLIYNSVAFAVLQRRNLIGVLRALGVTRGQILGLVICEAFVLGSVGAVLGVFGGILLGEQLLSLVSQTLNDHYFIVKVSEVSISFSTIIKGTLAGLGATLVAAAIPALEASGVQPRLAMTRSVIEHTARSTVPRLACIGAVVFGLAVAVLSVSAGDLVWGLFAVFLVIFAYALCIPAGVRFLSRLLMPVVRKLSGVTVRLAAGGIVASLSRTGVAIVALAIAVATTIGVSIMVQSFRDSVGNWLDSTLNSDVYLGVPRGSLDPDLMADLLALPGIQSFSASRRAWLQSADGRVRILAFQPAPDMPAGFELRLDDAASAWEEFVSEEAVMVSDSYAYTNQVTHGDVVTLETLLGTQTFRIAAVYQSYDANDGTVLMNRNDYERYFGDRQIDSIGLYLRPGVEADAVMQELRSISAGRQSLIMNSNAKIRELSLRVFDRTFVITNVIYWLVVAVAIVGILGAMLALQLERAREIGVLRSIGMTPWQVGRLIGTQSLVLGVLSGIAAIPLGIVMAILLIEVINRRAFGWEMDISISAGGLVAALLLAIGASLLASIYPAMRAAATEPALAMREE